MEADRVTAQGRRPIVSARPGRCTRPFRERPKQCGSRSPPCPRRAFWLEALPRVPGISAQRPRGDCGGCRAADTRSPARRLGSLLASLRLSPEPNNKTLGQLRAVTRKRAALSLSFQSRPVEMLTHKNQNKRHALNHPGVVISVKVCRGEMIGFVLPTYQSDAGERVHVKPVEAFGTQKNTREKQIWNSR